MKDIFKLLSLMILRRAKISLKTLKWALIIYLLQPILWILTLGISLNGVTSVTFLKQFNTSFLDFEIVGVPIIFALTIPLFGSFSSRLEFSNSTIYVVHLLSNRKIIYYFMGTDVIFYAIITFVNVLTVAGLSFILTSEGVNVIGLLAVLPLMLLGSLTSYSLGIIINSLFRNLSSPTSYLFSLIQVILILFSGVYYPLSYLPEYLRIIAFISPYSHLIALIRYILLGYNASDLNALWFYTLPYQVQVVLSISYVIVLGVILFILAGKR